MFHVLNPQPTCYTNNLFTQDISTVGLAQNLSDYRPIELLDHSNLSKPDSLPDATIRPFRETQLNKDIQAKSIAFGNAQNLAMVESVQPDGLNIKAQLQSGNQATTR